MIEAKNLLTAVVDSLRHVIGPAVTDPYAKAQAFMAAVILEFVARQVDERADVATGKSAALAALAEDLRRLPQGGKLLGDDPLDEAGLGRLIERLYNARSELGEAAFVATNQRIRQALRQLLEQEFKVVGKGEG